MPAEPAPKKETLFVYKQAEIPPFSARALPDQRPLPPQGRPRPKLPPLKIADLSKF